MRNIIVASLLVIAGTGTALAAEDRFQGVFVTSPEMCETVGEAGGHAIFKAREMIGKDIALMSLKDGVIGWEFFCDFNEITAEPNGNGLNISGYCGTSGDSFDEEIYLSIYDDTRIEFTSLNITGTKRPDDEDEDEDKRFLFSRCDEVKELKLD